MQIRNEYNSYSGTGYQQSHTHHITECLHAEKRKQNGASAMGIKQEDRLSGKKEAVADKTPVNGFGSVGFKRLGSFKKGKSFLKNAWESLGENGQQTKEGRLSFFDGQKLSASGISAVTAAIKQGFSTHIVNKWEAVKEKIKVGIHSSLKRFKRGSDAFAALTDTGSQAAGEKGMGRRQMPDGRKKTGSETQEMVTAYRTESHLLDSYSKTGEYCRLNENLTYQKNAAVKRDEKPVKDSEEMLDKG